MASYDDGGFVQSSPKKDLSQQRSLRSVTLKQLQQVDIEQTPLQLDKATLTQLTIFGWVRATKKTSAGFGFTLDDMTGHAECTFWPNGVYDEEMSGLIEENAFLKVSGSVRVFNNKVCITASHLQRIVDSNFITYHFASCIYQHLYFNDTLKRELKEQKKEVVKNFGGFTALQEEIIEVYRKNQDENGLHVDVVVRMLSGKYGETVVRENIEVLLSDCHLYSVDGLEYKTTY